MYRARPWTMRQIAGFGTAEDTNQRFQYLIAQGQTGLSTDFDMPTLMGYDCDDPMSEGEVGREGVAIDTLADMERLFDGIDLETIAVSMTINPCGLDPARDVRRAGRGARLRPRTGSSGTIQADILKEYSRAEGVDLPVRAVACGSCATRSRTARGNMPRYNPINISGYHISRGGRRPPSQEVAFTMATRDRVRRGGRQDRACDVDEFAPRLAFFFVCQADFFEEIAKFRAARRVLREDHEGALRRAGTRSRCGCASTARRRRPSLTKPQPLINVVRTALAGAGRGARRRAVAAHQRHGRGVRDPDRGRR